MLLLSVMNYHQAAAMARNIPVRLTVATDMLALKAPLAAVESAYRHQVQAILYWINMVSQRTLLGLK